MAEKDDGKAWRKRKDICESADVQLEFKTKDFEFFEIKELGDYIVRDFQSRAIVARIEFMKDFGTKTTIEAKGVFEALAGTTSKGIREEYDERTLLTMPKSNEFSELLTTYLQRLSTSIKEFLQYHKKQAFPDKVTLSVTIFVAMQLQDKCNYQRMWRRLVPKGVTISQDTFMFTSYGTLKAVLELSAPERTQRLTFAAADFISEINLNLAPREQEKVRLAMQRAINAMIEGKDSFDERNYDACYQISFEWKEIEQDA